MVQYACCEQLPAEEGQNWTRIDGEKGSKLSSDRRSTTSSDLDAWRALYGAILLEAAASWLYHRQAGRTRTEKTLACEYRLAAPATASGYGIRFDCT